ncbi:hypothetical protein [Archaeoglobus fulgidus]|nr:hypothetical protein [Archaeoglobus fulgidus]AIG96978.1 hypothetical protein AFULGI_00001420 [Archaeoglobus fulgidus DSM 8774]
MAMMSFVAIVTPLTMLTGLIDWKYRYDMRKVPIIQRKVITGIVGYVFVVVYVVLHSLTDYSLAALAMALVFFAITGEYGGKLVHGARTLLCLKNLRKGSSQKSNPN